MQKSTIKFWGVINSVLFIVYCLLFIHNIAIHAQGPMIDRGDGYAVFPTPRPTTNPNVSKEASIRKILEQLFGGSQVIPTGANTSPPPSSPTPSQSLSRVSPTSSNVSPTVEFSPIPPTGNFVSYRQCNYTHITMWGGCTICQMGCGITSAAMIIASFGNRSINPENLHSRYRENEWSAGCGGSYIGDAKTAIEKYGNLRTTQYLFRHVPSVPMNTPSVVDDIRGHVSNGNPVFALLEFCEGGCGHFVVITGMNEQNRFVAYDPYYEPNSTTQPISYGSRPYQPKIRVAFAVIKPPNIAR